MSKKYPVTALAIALAIASSPGCKRDRAPRPASPAARPSTATADAQAPQAAPTLDAAALIQAQIDFNNRRFDDALTHHAEHAVWRETGSPVPPVAGREGAKKAWQAMVEAFPDVKTTATRVIVLDGGERFVVESVTRGTHEAAIGGLKPTGKVFGIRGAERIATAAGKITETETYQDALTMLAQLGARQLPEGMPPAPDPATLPTEPPEVVSAPPGAGVGDTAARFLAAWARDEAKDALELVTDDVAFRDHLTGATYRRADLDKAHAADQAMEPRGGRTTEQPSASGALAVSQVVRANVQEPGEKALHRAELWILEVHGGKVSAIDRYGSRMGLVGRSAAP